MLQLMDRLRYHAAIFLAVCKGIATMKTAILMGCMHLKRLLPLFDPEMPPDACMVISVFIPQVVLFCHPAS